MKNILKYGRFAFILPCIIVPIWLGIIGGEDLETIMKVSLFNGWYFLAEWEEDPVILLYPICFGISVLCWIFYMILKEFERYDNANSSEDDANAPADSAGCRSKTSEQQINTRSYPQNCFAKYGRFAFILPYIIIPLWFAAVDDWSFENIGIILGALFLMPITLFLLDDPIIWLYPICLGISIACVIVYKRMFASEEEGKVHGDTIGSFIIAVIVILIALPPICLIFGPFIHRLF